MFIYINIEGENRLLLKTKFMKNSYHVLKGHLFSVNLSIYYSSMIWIRNGSAKIISFICKYLVLKNSNSKNEKKNCFQVIQEFKIPDIYFNKQLK